jgi:hypothetical protein
MPHAHSLQFKPFVQQSKTAQGRYWIQSKNRARTATPLLGGRMSVGHRLFPGIQWLNGELLGPRRPQVFRLSLQTTRYAYAAECVARALDESYAMLDVTETLADWRATFTREWCPALRGWVYAQDTESVSAKARRARENEIFGGLERYDWATRRAAELAASAAIAVREEVKLDPGYQAGIGVVATLGYADLDAPNLKDFAARFAASGFAAFAGAVDLRYPEFGDPELLLATQHSNSVCW